MLDVIPPNSPSQNNPPPGGPGRSRRQPLNKPRPRTHIAVGPPTLQVEWKLPARLRRPIHQELERQRRRARARQAIVQFQRRPIRTQLPSEQITSAPNPPRSRGAEAHTGDIYRTSKPDLRITLPPYSGQYLRRRAMPGPRRPAHIPRQTPRQTSPARPQITTHHPRSRRVPVAQHVPVAAATTPTPAPDFGHHRLKTPDWTDLSADSTNQRHTPPDVALIEDNATPQRISEPKRRLALPLHFSIFPKSLLPRRQRRQALSVSDSNQAALDVTAKKKISHPR